MSFRIILILLLIVPSLSIAEPRHGSAIGVVSDIIVKETGNIIVKFESPHGDPMECGNSTYAIIENGNTNKQEFLSVMLAGYMANQKQSFWITGCITAYNKMYSKITTVGIGK